MQFNSLPFLLFLPAVFLVYWCLLRTLRLRNAWLLAASWFFYSCWSVKFLGLILLTTVCAFACGLLLERARSRGLRLAWLWANVTINLGILFLFKYFDFFAAGFLRLAALAGWNPGDVTLHLVLPVGISFYTFQSLSYTIDVYRRQLPPTRSFIDFALFISFFPQLVAGPIERATNLLPQFQSNRPFDYSGAVSGMKLILWGLFKKMVVADTAGNFADLVFADPTAYGTLNAWVGAFLFTVQIYCDFSGYSDMAVGIARLFSVRLTRNFRMPYFSTSIQGFWQGWHISLTNWLRDYIYIPLGGNRRGRARTVRNSGLVFLASGLWHGADLTFVAWGLWHWIISVPGILHRKRGVSATSAPGAQPGLLFLLISWGVTFIAVLLGWVLFRAPYLKAALFYFREMFVYAPSHGIVGKQALVWAALLFASEWLTRKRETPLTFAEHGLLRWSAARWVLYLGVFLLCMVMAGETEQFIYFQF